MAVATAMPRAVGELNGLPYYAWAFSAFVVTSLFAMVVAGEMCDVRGPMRPIVGGVIACSPSACWWPAPRWTWRCSSPVAPCRGSAAAP